MLGVQPVTINAGRYAEISGTKFEGKTTHQVKAESSGSLDEVKRENTNDKRAREIRDEFNLLKATFLQHSEGPKDIMKSESHVGLSGSTLKLTKEQALLANPGLLPKLASYFSSPDQIATVRGSASGQATIEEVDGQKQVVGIEQKTTGTNGLYGMYIQKAADTFITSEKLLERDDAGNDVYRIKSTRKPFDQSKPITVSEERVSLTSDGLLHREVIVTRTDQ